MAVVSGFEGFEKRIELRFSVSSSDSLGLRRLSTSSILQVLATIQCTIVSAVGNRSFDSYILSESSLFIYPHRIIIKTCGTTQLLKSIPLLLRHVADAGPLGGLRLLLCRYSRGSFIFPHFQPFPHSDFRHEVAELENLLPSHLSYRKSAILHHSWHVYSASAAVVDNSLEPDRFTVEVCMTELDRKLARAFYKTGTQFSSGDEVGREMTVSTGIDRINTRATSFGYAFEPCGYSMNGLDRNRYSTIHVTPEEGYSYASFECDGGRFDANAGAMIEKAVRVFGPGTVSVSVVGTARCEEVWSTVAESVERMGFECRARLAEEFPGVGGVTYQAFSRK